jgi:hypothetical protein
MQPARLSGVSLCRGRGAGWRLAPLPRQPAGPPPAARSRGAKARNATSVNRWQQVACRHGSASNLRTLFTSQPAGRQQHYTMRVNMWSQPSALVSTDRPTGHLLCGGAAGGGVLHALPHQVRHARRALLGHPGAARRTAQRQPQQACLADWQTQHMLTRTWRACRQT